MDRLPHFIVIGAARSGTTTLYRGFKQHPQIFMSAIKETNFFAFEDEKLAVQGPGAEFINNSITKFDDYRALFAGAPEGSIIGEASPLYLYVDKAPAGIAARLPNARLLAVLRNPIEQAFSHYLYARANMIEPIESFDAAIDAEPERKALGWQPLFQYSSFPRYGEQIARFLRHFPREQFKIALFEDLEKRPEQLMQEFQSFIGADAAFVPKLGHANPGGVPRNAALQRLVMQENMLTRTAALLVPKQLRRRVRDRISSSNTVKPEMSRAARARLTDALRDDILHLQDLIGINLGGWLEPPKAT
jgi:hypothetical protein